MLFLSLFHMYFDLLTIILFTIIIISTYDYLGRENDKVVKLNMNNRPPLATLNRYYIFKLRNYINARANENCFIVMKILFDDLRQIIHCI